MSLKSMTAFGSGESTSSTTTYRCEIRTLNSRFCDISIKMPRSLIALEPSLINRVKEKIMRGKVDVFLDLVPNDRAAGLPQLNTRAVSHYLAASQALAQAAGITMKPLSSYELMRLDGVLENQFAVSSEEQVRAHEDGIFAAMEKALSNVLVQRKSEGQALTPAFVKIIEGMQADREAIVSKREVIQKHLFDNYKKRLERLLSSLEETGQKITGMLPEERLLAEVTLLIDRSDIEEELTRLSAHEVEFKRLLQGGEEVGRRMDFLCQEMHREVNTISNKLTQLEVAQHSLSLKQAVERLRQQVANIE
ncbi:MAG TPA: YicC/YloC family endoribonuclease [Oligoflexus sp.]|uniref:YicC/YloC family endoribonuclease n=1 Tax=Oligoflexus sp. TaxID=1971216 RepID=UPI002D463B6F|nr:YicC/YloC family endoribonuclease [Oligoflexus sp.]HYX39522.1 YicC/YloC family endoribonuclease [Oligoflexus sp.]